MGEIRSTLDIIMEKTKGLTLSEEEKKAFKEQEMAGKLRGLIQKYLNGSVDMDKLKEEIAALADEDEDMVMRLIREETVSRMGLGENNDSVLTVLEETTGWDVRSIRASLKAFEQRFERERISREKELGKKLEEKGISGSAVMPNINADPKWAHYLSEIRDEFKEKVGS